MREAIQSAISENPVILFMKGTPEQPMCGFSARTVAMLESLDQPFAAVNILPDPRIRQELSALSGWPTIPQLFVDGELVGGCDIVVEMYETGELQQLLGTEGDAEPAAAEEPRSRSKTGCSRPHEPGGRPRLAGSSSSHLRGAFFAPPAVRAASVRPRRAARVSGRRCRVAIVSDTCHYLPRELVAANRDPRGQPLRPPGRQRAA